MKTKLPLLIIIGLLVAVAFFIPVVSAAKSETGNGAQSGPHFNLNIIGSKNAKSMPDDLTGVNQGGHVIFCPLKGPDAETPACRIYLKQAPDGESFMVIDKDGTDGTARFQLPRPYEPGEDVMDPANSAYKIYIRVTGKPGGTGKILAGLCNTTDGIICDSTGTWMSNATHTVTLASHSPNTNKASQKFVDWTHELTTIDLTDLSICGVDHNIKCGHVGLFDNNPFGWNIEDDVFVYFWDLWNNNMKNIQMRFYPVDTT